MQSLNEAEKVADQMWAAARALMEHSQAPHNLFAKAVDYAMYVDARTASTASRDWITPYEMVKKSQPTITKLHRFYTRAFVAVPKAKRKDLADRGLHNFRSEPGRFIGFQTPYSTTYAVMLDKIKHQADRLVHSINVTFNDQDYKFSTQPSPAREQEATDQLGVQPHHSVSDSPDHIPPSPDNAQPNPLFNQFTYVHISPLQNMPPAAHQDSDQEMFDISHEGPWLTHAGDLKPRPRPVYATMEDI